MRSRSYPVLLILLVAGFLAVPLSARGEAQREIPLAPTHSLQAREVQMEQPHGRELNGSTARQSLHCWQVTQGVWNGQTLDGLALVLLQPLTEDGQPSRQANVYISDFATPAQREALLSALAAAHPDLFITRGSAGMKIEPACIQLEQVDPQTLVLHLGLIAMGPSLSDTATRAA